MAASTDTPRRAVIYTRLSQDRGKGTEGEGVNVARQEAECRELADRLHPPVEIAGVRTDNDISAFKGGGRSKTRRGYDALLGDIRSGNAEVVIAWHTDRLLRDMTELEGYIGVCGVDPGVPTHTVRAGSLDLTTASGRMVARILGAVQQQEVEHMIERQKSAKDRIRKAGDWQGTPRPFGFAVVPKLDASGSMMTARNGGIRHTIEPHPVEAPAVREAYKRVLAGDGLETICNDWNARGLLTPKMSSGKGGQGFNHSSLRLVLIRAANAGLIEHGGQVVRKANWDPIVAEDTWRAVRAILTDPARRTTPGPKPRHLLTGILVCGKCEGTTFAVIPAGTKGRKKLTYYCASKSLRDDGVMRHNGCVGRNKERLDEYVEWLIIEKLKQPGMAKAFVAPGVDVASLDIRRQAINDELDQIAASKFPMRQKNVMASPLIAELDQVEQQISTALQGSPLGEFGDGKDPEKVWRSLPIERQRAVAAKLLRVVLLPARSGARPAGWKPGDPHVLDDRFIRITSPDGTPWGDPE